MKFIVGNGDYPLGEMEITLRLVDASSKKEAIEKYKYAISLFDPFIREAVLDKSVNAFAEKFFATTEKEKLHLATVGEPLPPQNLVKRRICNYFEDRPDIATAYSNYLFEDSTAVGDEDFPSDFWEYLIVRRSDHNLVNVIAIAMGEIPSL